MKLFLRGLLSVALLLAWAAHVSSSFCLQRLQNHNFDFVKGLQKSFRKVYIFCWK